MKTGVILGGQPGSGNCLIRDMLVAAGAAKGYVLHNGDMAVSDKMMRLLSDCQRVEVVIPVRHPSYAEESSRRRGQRSPRGWTNQLRLARRLNKTPYFVSYEALVADPETIGREILEHCGLHVEGELPWPSPIHDANAKYVGGAA